MRHLDVLGCHQRLCIRRANSQRARTAQGADAGRWHVAVASFGKSPTEVTCLPVDGTCPQGSSVGDFRGRAAVCRRAVAVAALVIEPCISSRAPTRCAGPTRSARPTRSRCLTAWQGEYPTLSRGQGTPPATHRTHGPGPLIWKRFGTCLL